ncbi:MAG: type IV secretion system protein [Phycisphaerales bacterium]|nr:type IV secretion system protein [Hyphomonadaceae bacterium]
MAMLCPAPGPDDPLVRGLLSVVDCNIQSLVVSGYSALFQPSSQFSGLLTSLLVIFVAIIGYRLMLGQSALRLGDLALTAAKLGIVLALTTQWSVYQRLVYDFLFYGPQAMADVMLGAVQPEGSVFRGNVFDGLQQTIDFLGGHAEGYAAQSPMAASPLLGGAGFGAFALTMSSTILLFSSLGVLLAAKIVLGLLLAIGPIFIALALFESTRSLFEGWLRAALAFAFAPLATTVLLGLALNMLEPWLLQLADMRAANDLSLAPVYGIFTLVLVFAGVSLGMIAAGGFIAAGFRLQPGAARADDASAQKSATIQTEAAQTRVAQIAAAAASLTRHEASLMLPGRESVYDRRTVIANLEAKSWLQPAGASAAPAGAQVRRRAGPRASRARRKP